MDPRDRLIVALDLDGREAAEAMVQRLGDSVTFYKIGYQLAFSGGLGLARDLVQTGRKVFLDMKLHDIGNTVAHGTAAIARTGATFLTVHAYPQTLEAAADGAKGSGLKILGVTVLTSYDEDDLSAAGYAFGVQALVARRAEQAAKAGVAGLILSPEEVAAIRRRHPDLTLVTPGVRPAGAAANGQKRVKTPGAAIRAGADHLVVGRPITAAADPRAAAEAIQAEISLAAGALSPARAAHGG
jgi:orotidine-5'-phosphate decarboxylase